MDSIQNTCTKTADYFNCRLMPHGGIIIFPSVISTLALCASLADDGCDYARLRGAAVEMLTGSSAVPFVDCGMTAYRIPGYYPADNTWRVVYSDECQPYEYMNLLADTSWVAAEWLRFLALVIGGTTAMFLWTSACLTLRPNYWNAAGIGAAVTCLFQMCSFVWFYTKLCHANTTNLSDFEAGRTVETTLETECTLFFGSKCVITSTVLWALAAAVILLRPYPHPVPKYIAHEEEGTPIVPSVSQLSSSQQSSKFTLTAPSKRGSKMQQVKGKGSFRSMGTMSTAQESQRSLPYASESPDGTTLRTSVRASNGVVSGNNEYMNNRPKELSGSAMSQVTFA